MVHIQGLGWQFQVKIDGKYSIYIKRIESAYWINFHKAKKNPFKKLETSKVPIAIIIESKNMI